MVIFFLCGVPPNPSGGIEKMIVQAQRTIIFLIIILLLNTCLIQAACRDVNLTYRLPNFAHAANADAIIGYFGHNFFQITTKKGTKSWL